MFSKEDFTQSVPHHFVCVPGLFRRAGFGQMEFVKAVSETVAQLKAMPVWASPYSLHLYRKGDMADTILYGREVDQDVMLFPCERAHSNFCMSKLL